MKGFFDDLKKEYKNGFYVHISKERKDLQMTVGYIGRYARRPPLSEVRIKNYTGERITFEYKGSSPDRVGNENKIASSEKSVGR